MSKKPNLDDYNDVPARIAEFRAKHPEGSLQSEYEFVQVDGRSWAVVKAYAYREPNDPRPGVGIAWELVPGKTPYTRDSELQNAETSAWGRAIIAAGAADAKKIASMEEVRNRTADELPPEPVDEEAAEARDKLRAWCEENGHDLTKVAGAFLSKFGHNLKGAPADEVTAFHALLQEGAITL